MEESVHSGYLILTHLPVLHIFFKPFSLAAGVGLLIMLILLLSSALCSGSEIALFSLSATDISKLEHSKARNDKLIIQLLEKPNKLLATILIGNNFLNIGIIILSTYIINLMIDFGQHTTIKFITQAIIVTFMILLIGEVIPKIYANYNSKKMARFMAYPLHFLRKILNPLSFIMLSTTKVVDKRIKRRSHDISVNELSEALELTSRGRDEEGDKKEKKMLKGIIKFGEIAVRQAMKSRLDVLAINVNTSFNEVIKIIKSSGFSRIPVYKDNIDNIKGVLYIKDVLPSLNKEKDFNWQHIIRKAFFVPENKRIDDLLADFQSKKIHLAIVVDEYGGTMGIITMEDILEEITGEISDEFDEDDLIYSKLDEYNYIFEGKTPLTDIYKILNIEGSAFEEEKGDAETLAGYIIEVVGRIPKKNERIELDEYTLMVESADKRRVKRVKLTLKRKNKNNKR